MLKGVISKFTVVAELLSFFWERKLWWMVPFVVILLLFGVLIIFAQTSPVAPFVYPLF